MRKVLIPTKLDKFAAAMLEERGYNVVLDTANTFEDAIKANSDAEALIVRSEKVTPEVIDQLPDKDQMILVYCRSGNRSKQASEKLVDLGYTNVVEFGGIMDWTGEIVTGE